MTYLSTFLTLRTFFALPVRTEGREELETARFFLGPDYGSWIWRERMKANPPQRTVSLGKWPFVRPETNVVKISKARGK